jgi:hypothetical protein
MKTGLQSLNSLGYRLYELFKIHEDLLSHNLGLGIQCAELINSINSLIDIKEKELSKL